MFTKKVSKAESTAQLLHLLTKRSSLKRISINKGVYNEWPSDEKPSLFNCSTNYIKYLSACNSEYKDAESIKEKRKKAPSYAKQPATFSTCTTMEFYPTTQQNIEFKSRFTTTHKNQYENSESQPIKKQNSVPYMTPLQNNSQIFDKSDSHLKHMNEQDYEGKLDSKYGPRPKTVDPKKKASHQERRLIKTAKIHRQKLQTQEMNEELCNGQKLSAGLAPSSFAKSISIKNPAIINQVIKGNSMKSTTLRSNSSKQNISINYDYPMRLKDYETNFQAYKLISELIDQQMKWQPKRSRPKSSVLFRKYNMGSKV